MAKKSGAGSRGPSRSDRAGSGGEATGGGPRASRPHVPGYGIPADTKGMLPWSYADEQLGKAMNYWVCTVGAGGAPHARPVWGLWVDGALCFGGHGVRWDRNLAANPNVSVHLESGDQVVILEGAVERVEDMNSPLAKRAAEASKKKYGMGGGEGAFWALRPRRAFGWTTKAMFKDATRWHFQSPE